MSLDYLGYELKELKATDAAAEECSPATRARGRKTCTTM